MGIPSFYKHLLQTVGGLTTSKRSQAPHIFALDLNCAIYHCTRKIQRPYTHETKSQWEHDLIQQVLGYIQRMTRIVGPKQSVYIAVDGVAPMAKIKQQRARRFKSAITAQEEGRVRAEASGKVYEPGERWDTNAITPGTGFMQNLTTALRSFRMSGVHVVVSPADEAGEGEQKIMAWLRSQPYETTQDVVIYGLDADLIVLAMMEHARSGRTVDLFREETEFNGSVKSNALGEEQYLYLQISHLAKVLHSTWAAPKVSLRDFLYDFVGAMNLLGNDFVPHGMSLKIHDEGIEHVLTALKHMQPYSPLVHDGAYSVSTLTNVLRTISLEEERYIVRNVRRKLDARPGVSSSTDEEARAIARLNDKPLEWAAERCMTVQKYLDGQEHPRWFMKPDWKTIYDASALWGCSVESVCTDYLHTLQWTLDYYVGKPVNMSWYYPWFLPPRMESLVESLQTYNSSYLSAPDMKDNVVLKPIEQLAMVLPVTSFHLLPSSLQSLPKLYPHAWPSSWGYFSLGRRFLWECEPLIPLIQPSQIQQWIEELSD
jgi:5'-3' exonuclease